MEAKLTAQAEKLAAELATQAGTVDDLNALLRGLMKSALQRMLDAEMDAHLKGQGPPLPFEPPAPKNRRNGRSPKTLQGEMGELTIGVPRDRHGTFEPQLVGRHQRRLAGFDEKALGCTPRA